MTSISICEDLRTSLSQHGPAGACQALIEELRSRGDYHKLFDALCLARKQQMGLPLGKPTSLDDVPTADRESFEQSYMAAAREVGQLLIAAGKLSQAWIYFQAIRETEPVRTALDQLPLPREANEATEELIELALFKGVHPVKGVQIMLKTHGTCSTITTLDQSFPRLSTDDRARCAAAMVQTLHQDLLLTLQREVQQRLPFTPPGKTLLELISGRDWLFDDSNYHIDVSHLNATVRFARSLAVGAPELGLARDLAEYGSRLAPQFQYAGEPPFVSYYPAHIQFFNVLLNDQRESALGYFRQQLTSDPDPQDQAAAAYALVDLLVRIDQFPEALELAEAHLLAADTEFATAFAELCEQAGRFDVLQRTAEARGDLVTFTTAILQQAALSPKGTV
jgi:tetratricopeptide (TPR) repeat protein